MQEKYGFVYLWLDRKHKRYYVGSHWGTEDDGYVCSSPWMKSVYVRRPHNFKRRIIARIYTSKIDLLNEEHRWLKMIKPEEFQIRYYNKINFFIYHWSADPERRKNTIEKMHKPHRGTVWNKGLTSSEETKKKLSQALKGRKVWNTGKKYNWTKEQYEKHGYIHQKKKWYTNGTISCKLDEPLPGFIPGRICVLTIKGRTQMVANKIGKRCYNNGDINKWFIPTNEPLNFTLGRMKSRQ